MTTGKMIIHVEQTTFDAMADWSLQGIAKYLRWQKACGNGACWLSYQGS